MSTSDLQTEYTQTLPTYQCKAVKCFIFDQKHFEGESGLPTRQGTERDRYGLDETFRRMNIIPEIHIDRRMNEIFAILENFAIDVASERCDCLIVCILPHEDGKGGLAAFDTTYPLESLYEVFYADKCPKLVGKPKLFIVDTTQRVDTCAMPFDGPRSKILPVQSDFLVVISRYRQYISSKDVERGSLFIHSFVSVFNENLTSDQKLDVELLFLIVKNRFANTLSEASVLPKQPPVTISTLRTKLFLPFTIK